MSEVPFQFAVLRYIHDPATEEFINVGVAVYSREERFLKAKISQKYQRLSDTFLSANVNGSYYRRIANSLENAILRLHRRYQNELALEELPAQIESVLAQVLTPDNSSLVFGRFGGGVTDNLTEELIYLYQRLVERYTEAEDTPSRDEEEIWRVYREEFDRLDVTRRLEMGVTLRSPRYDQNYEFRSAWRNERLHPLEPVSFDLVRPGSIREKANKWVGRSIALEGNEEIGTLYMLVGAPRRAELRHTYEQALLYLKNEMRLDCEIVEERDAPEFSEKLAKMMSQH